MSRFGKLALAVAFLALPVAEARADDPPAPAKAKAKAKAKSKAHTKTARKADADEPPPCVHLARAAAPRPAPPQTMEESFQRMMDSMTRNPAGGFADVLREQEATALSEISLTPAEERRIGRDARREFLRRASAKGMPVVDDPARIRYLRELVARLAVRMKNRAHYPEIDVTLVRADVADGQSFPGGFLVFTTGLFDEPDEASVAGVVAHELGHLDRGHLNEYARREKLTQTAFQPEPGMGMPRPDQFMSRGMALGSLMMNPFRPEHEHEADCMAATWLYQEGYDPAALAGFLERIHERNRDRPDPPFLMIARSHPYSLDRRDAILDRLAQLLRWKPRNDLGRYPNNLRTLSPKPAER